MANNADSSGSELPLIKASELAQYSFCRRAWWLGVVKGLPAQNRAERRRGVLAHHRHGRQVRLAWRQQQWGWLLLVCGAVLLAAAGLGFWFF